VAVKLITNMTEWMKRNKWYVLVAAVVITILVVAAFAMRLPKVQVATASSGPLTLQIAASGVVEAESADLGFQTAGRILELYVGEGDRVSKSQLLARIEPGATIPSASVRAEVIQAPYNGTVAAVYLREGATVAPGQPVLRVVSDSNRWVTAFVAGEDAVHIRPGDRFTCRAGGYLSQPWEIVVEAVGKAAVPRLDLPGSANQVRVRCKVSSPGFSLPPGTEVDVDGEVLLLAEALLIPTAAVIHEGAENWVWVVADGRVHRRNVAIGPNNFVSIQVRSGLAPGDQVVVEGKQGLREGQRVKAVPMPPPTPVAPGGS